VVASVDNSAKGSLTGGADNCSTASFALGGSNRVLYALVMASAGTPLVPDQVKWQGSGGTALTQVSTTMDLPSGGGAFWKVSLWRLIAPTAATDTVYVHFASTIDEIGVIAVSFKDADQTTPNGTIVVNQGTGNGNVTATASGTSGDIVAGFMAFGDQNGNSLTISTTQTSLQEIEGATLQYEGLGANWTTSSGTTQAMTWTVSGTPATGGWGEYAFYVNAAGAGGGSSIAAISNYYRMMRGA
jgi:hypothetical protein